jgi:hypothetical protein
MRDLDVLTYPQGASGEWAPVLQRIMDAMNTRSRALQGMTGRYAASAPLMSFGMNSRAMRASRGQCTCAYALWGG